MAASASIDKLIRDKLQPGAVYAVISKPLKARSEKRIVQLSSAIRDKSQWFEKMSDPEVHQRWTNEAKAQSLTDKEIAYVFDELAYYASLRVPGSGVELSGVEGVWISDSLVEKETLKELKDYTAILENVPEKHKDYHPNSNDQVLNLIHPSLFPLIYRKSTFLPTPIPSPEAAVRLATFGRFPGSPGEWRKQLGESFKNEGGEPAFYVPVKPTDNSYVPGATFISEEFCWLPTEFSVDKDGSAAIESYINNLHPIKHAALYPTIAKIFSNFVPMLEQVVTDLAHPRERRVVPDCSGWFRSDEPEPEYGSDEDDDAFEERHEVWEENRVFIEPQPEQFTAPDRPAVSYSLRGRRLQAIVKMSSIQLTPENPSYAGGNWHVEAMANERIIATGIYYYDVENITESRLEFRESVDEDVEYEQNDFEGVRRAYDIYDSGIDRDDEVRLVQHMGSVEVRNGRCICFPNVYQHQVSGFRLADPTKPGHRKIFAFFFVDPSTRIPSTEIVPPQQKDWWAEDALNAGPLKDLPLLIQEAINSSVDFPLSLREAKELRLDLMKERSVSNESTSDYFTPEFYLCEH